MQCPKCHTEFSSSDNAYCPQCGAPVRSALPPLPPRSNATGCLLGCAATVILLPVIIFIVPLLLMLLSNFLVLPSIFDKLAQTASHRLEQITTVPQQSMDCKYNLYGTMGQDTEIYMALDEPEPGTLKGHLYLQAPSQDYTAPLSVTGSISKNDDVTITVTDSTNQQSQHWSGIAVTNPDGIAAIQGKVTETGEKFYVTRR